MYCVYFVDFWHRELHLTILSKRPFNFSSPVWNQDIHVYDNICGFYQRCFSASEIKVSITHSSSMCFKLNQYFKGFILHFKFKFLLMPPPPKKRKKLLNTFDFEVVHLLLHPPPLHKMWMCMPFMKHVFSLS